MTAETKTLWVPGKPASQPRPRRGASGHTYMPDSGWQAQVYAAWYEKYGAAPVDDLVEIQVDFMMGGSEPGVFIRVSPPPQGGKYALGRQDLDRLVGAVLDALAGHVLGGRRLPPLAYRDDRQVVRLVATKLKTGGVVN